VTRVSLDTIELAPIGGYLLDPSSLLVRPREEHFAAGQTVPLGSGQVRIDAVTQDGRPERISLQLNDIDNPHWLWVAWDPTAQSFKPISLPVVGQAVWLPSSTP
jgi:hypothetical protein